MTVKYLVKYMGSSKKTPTAFCNQEFFNDFRWQNFEHGDIVWLEDYGTVPGKIFKSTVIAGVFLRIDNDDAAVIRLIPNKDGEILARNNIESLLNYNDYWQRYLKG